MTYEIEDYHSVLELIIVGGGIKGLSQQQIADYFKRTKGWVNKWCVKKGIDWIGLRTLAKSYLNPSKINESTDKNLLPSRAEIEEEAIANITDESLFQLFDSRIDRLSKEIKESIFAQLRHDFIHEDNELLAQDIRAEIDKTQARPELKLMLKQAVNSFTAKPNPQWLNSIASILKDIDAQKYKHSGLQENGDVIYTYRMTKKAYEYFRREGLDFDNVVNYCIKQLPI